MPPTRRPVPEPIRHEPRKAARPVFKRLRKAAAIGALVGAIGGAVIGGAVSRVDAHLGQNRAVRRVVETRSPAPPERADQKTITELSYRNVMDEKSPLKRTAELGRKLIDEFGLTAIEATHFGRYSDDVMRQLARDEFSLTRFRTRLQALWEDNPAFRQTLQELWKANEAWEVQDTHVKVTAMEKERPRILAKATVYGIIAGFPYGAFVGLLTGLLDSALRLRKESKKKLERLKRQR